MIARNASPGRRKKTALSWKPRAMLSNGSAAYGRREPRDVVDLLTVHEEILPLGAAVWASVGKSPGFSPEGIINEIRRTAQYTVEDFRRIASDPPVDAAATMNQFREALAEAE